MASRDIKNNALVHAILVRNYINPQRVDHSVIHNIVNISGVIELRREASVKDKKIAEAAIARTLDKIEGELKKLPEIEFIKYNLDNFIRQGRRWICTSFETAPTPHKKTIAGEDKRVRL